MNYGDRIANEVVQNLVDMLESGVDGKWSAPWTKLAGSLPLNASTGKEYRGWNIFGLAIAAIKKEYKSNYWATFNQWKALGAKVKKGSKTETICFWQPNKYEKTNPTTGKVEEKDGVLFKVYRVLNADCVEGWEEPTIEGRTFNAVEECEATINATGANIQHIGNRACYIPSLDCIHLPPREAFDSEENYYATSFHELGHWTGSDTRLNRQFGKRFGDDAYAFEELVAELSAAILCAKHGIEAVTRQSHAQYVAHWVKMLQADPKALFTAGSQASKAVDYITEMREHEQAEEEAQAA